MGESRFEVVRSSLSPTSPFAKLTFFDATGAESPRRSFCPIPPSPPVHPPVSSTFSPLSPLPFAPLPFVVRTSASHSHHPCHMRPSRPHLYD